MNTSSRSNILARLRSVSLPAAELPDLPAAGPWQTFDDPIAQFTVVLSSVGGRCERCQSVQDADQRLRMNDAWQSGPTRISLVHGVGDSTRELSSVSDPHELESVDFAVLPGEFAVAENGAVWVTDRDLTHRVLFFIPQHVALVVPESQIVNNMHEAYARLNIGDGTFGAFISGPSKTADIEQSLVIGAHGARSLTVFLVPSGELSVHRN